jgi:hypothetical protein
MEDQQQGGQVLPRRSRTAPAGAPIEPASRDGNSTRREAGRTAFSRSREGGGVRVVEGAMSTA